MDKSNRFTNDLTELKVALMNAKQSTETFTAQRLKTPNCVVKLSQALSDLKKMQIKLKNNQ